MNKNIKSVVLVGAVIVIVGGIYIWDYFEITPLDAKRLGVSCEIDRACGNLVGIDCKSRVDGPYYYINKENSQIVSVCGGACMTGECTNCPPKEWSCDVY